MENKTASFEDFANDLFDDFEETYDEEYDESEPAMSSEDEPVYKEDFSEEENNEGLFAELQGLFDKGSDGVSVGEYEEVYQREKDYLDEMPERTEEDEPQQSSSGFDPNGEVGFVVETQPSKETVETIQKFIGGYTMLVEEIDKHTKALQLANLPPIRIYSQEISDEQVKVKAKKEELDKIKSEIAELTEQGQDTSAKEKEKEQTEKELGKLKKNLSSKIKDKMGLKKTNYAKPKEEKSFKSTLIKVAIAGLIISGFFAVMSQSYVNYCYSIGKPAPSVFGALFGWMSVSSLSVDLSVIDFDIVLPVFGIVFGLYAVIATFVLLEADQKKRSRVGHEHGSARLGTSRDFKKFQKRFIE